MTSTREPKRWSELGKLPWVWVGVSKRLDTDTAEGKKYPWLVRCPAPMCFYNVSAKSEKDAERVFAEHQEKTCPWYGGGSTTFGWSIMSEGFISKIWKMLDDQVDIIKDPNQIPEHREAAGKTARGIAMSLSVLMPPFFHNADDIVRESIKRWNARQAGDDTYQTNGVGHLAWKKAMTDQEIASHTGQAKTPVIKDKPAVAQVNLGEREQLAIRTAADSGLFTPEQIAATYKVDVAIVTAIIEAA